MKHIGLFEGIGGFSLAGRWMGWETVAWCELDEFCQKVLKYHFPEAEQHGDITTTDFTRYAGQIDVLTGGFPCQPYSSAGKRLGKEDDRHLWPEMLRAIREIQPRWVVGENVRGLTNWNGGLVFDEVQADLENEGYEVTPYLLPACAVNAPHRRDRVWFIAYSNKSRNKEPELQQPNIHTGSSRDHKQATPYFNKTPTRPPGASGGADSIGILKDATNSTQAECKQPGGTWSGREGLADLRPGQFSTNANEKRLGRQTENGYMGGEQRFVQRIPGRQWEDFPTKPPVRSRNDGIPDGLVGITFSKHREKSIGAYGNAIVPQVALQIFKAIQDYEL